MDPPKRSLYKNIPSSITHYDSNTRGTYPGYSEMDNQGGIIRLPDELLLIILSFLPSHSQITLGLTCKTLLDKVQPSSIVDTEVKDGGLGLPHLTYLHLIKKDIPKSWVCYCCYRIHTTLLHPSFSSLDYLTNLESWVSLLPPISPLSPNLLPITLSYGSPTCIPFELSAYTSLLSPSRSSFVTHKTDHSLATASCDLRMAFALKLTRIFNYNNPHQHPHSLPSPSCIILPCSESTNLETTTSSSLTEEVVAPAATVQKSLILSHARHTIRFHPRGVRLFSASYVFEQTQALRIDVCPHIRLSADPDDVGNVVRGMLACAAGEPRPVRTKGHGKCGRKGGGGSGCGGTDTGSVSVSASSSVSGAGSESWSGSGREDDLLEGGLGGMGLEDGWSGSAVEEDQSGDRRRRRRRRRRAEHWVKCKEEGCGAEVIVWFDPKGVAGGSLGNGIMRMDIFKVLTGQAIKLDTNEENIGFSRWERRVGPIEQLWKEKGRDIWPCFGDDELGLLGFE
jgi:F-box domain